MKEIRVRFAPSPTGYLHVGGARTALFNWLFARKHQGTFILRIEDTDVSRSSVEMIEGILEGLKWLGLSWDEGPYFQTKRLTLYQDYAEQLTHMRAAYLCFCTQENLKAKQAAAAMTDRGWKYDRSCHNLSPSEVQEKIKQGIPTTIRFKVPEGRTNFTDLVHGAIEVDNENIEDFVLLRSDGFPTYHLSVVVDDLEMRISHVIRGADHIPNTSKQLLLYRALNKSEPAFAHLPLILGPDKQRLSKRHGATSVMAYKETGYVPEAVVNFLALLGWSPGGNREILSVSEMTKLFSLDAINKTNAVFDVRKLEWMNSQYIKSIPEERLLALVKGELTAKGLWQDRFDSKDRAWVLQIINLLKSRIKLITEFAEYGRAFFTEDFEYELDAVEKYLAEPLLLDLMLELKNRFASLPSFNLQTTEHALRDLAEKFSIKPAIIINALRVALTGKSAAPGIFDVVVTLGQEVVLARLDRLISYLQSKAVTKA